MTDLIEPHQYELADRYRADRGRVFLSGVQALARLPVEQLRADRAGGSTTAAFVSGYPGSPLGGFDREVRAAARTVPELPIVLRPAVNEELAATAVMGTQHVNLVAGARYDGVLGLWYGKTPGLDRASDAIRHGVIGGSDPAGGAVLLVGDDPTAKSSTLPSASDLTLQALCVPYVAPSDPQDALLLGRHAIALSRASGAWTAVKIVTPVADGTGTVDLDAAGFRSVIPELLVDGVPFVPRPTGQLLAPFSLNAERELVDVRLEFARRYATANSLNEVTVASPGGWLGIVAPGQTYLEVVEALRRLGLGSPADLTAVGVRLLRLRMPFPLDPATIRSFAAGLDEIVVVEDKRAALEVMVRDALYGRTGAPSVVGKRDPDGNPLFAGHGSLDADQVVEPLRRRLTQRVSPDRLVPARRPSERALIPLAVNRTPYFCSGCPHNTSTKVPEGTLVGGGIGCSSMIALMPVAQVGEVVALTSMGNEGANWIGMAPFVTTPHLVQTLGDGTYAHSGHLAIRAAIAAGVDMTYKILYNGAVSMTGGQHAEGILEVPALAQVLLLEGASRVLVTTDDPDRYDSITLPPGVEVWPRERITEAQCVLAAVAGTTVLIHDQACAAEKRRARKRGTLPTPTSRVLIDERVCEGCGDCGEASNCLSVQPYQTPYGRKTRIHQSSCNHDLSCMDGDCPSFATVVPRRSRRWRASRSVAAGRSEAAPDSFPAPVPIGGSDCTIRMSGIGGTGVVTVSQVLGTAALLDGRFVRGLDQTGLSQKAGPVVSDLRITDEPVDGSNKAPSGTVDVELAFDLLTAANPAHLAGAEAGRTVIVGSSTETPTGAMVVHPGLAAPSGDALRTRLDSVSRPEHNRYVDAVGLAEGLFGDAAMANLLLVGVAVQIGAIPLAPSSIEQAIELNGVAVDRNREAFRWGRQWAVDPRSVDAAAATPAPHAPETTDELIERLAADLHDYQSAAYAERFTTTVDRVKAKERAVAIDSDALTVAVARNLHKLMAYKDEYEVARLLLRPEASAAAEAVGGPGARVVWHLHPPVLRSMGMDRKISMGRWSRPLMTTLKASRRLRGTALDPFGRAEIRRTERAMIAEYEAAVGRLVEQLDPDNLTGAVAIAELPDQVRGYEGLKAERAAAYRAELVRRLDALPA